MSNAVPAPEAPPAGPNVTPGRGVASSSSSKGRPPLREAWLLAIGGALILGGGLVLLLYGPGFVDNSLFVRETGPSIAAALIGVLLLACAALSRNRRTARGGSPAGIVALSAGLAVFVVLLLLSVGLLPGLYYPSSGSVRDPIVGCGAGGEPNPPALFGFPPGARVVLTWATENGTEASVDVWQEAPNSAHVVWASNETGAFGQFAFVGRGGTAGWASEGSVKTCPTHHLEYVDVRWTYAVPV